MVLGIEAKAEIQETVNPKLFRPPLFYIEGNNVRMIITETTFTEHLL